MGIDTFHFQRLKIYWGQLCIGSSPIAGKQQQADSFFNGSAYFFSNYLSFLTQYTSNLSKIA
ncbi:MAG TPA: hypothetical protein DEZ27_08185 [Sphaerochaeta sp.]|nr:hypothetical protein [Sphaerochaeta sp.]